MTSSIQLTILFEEPFWIGLIEERTDRSYVVARHVFGAEPTDGEVMEWLSKEWARLRYSKPIKEKRMESKKISPKRLQREIGKWVEGKYKGTKAQQVLKSQQEENKIIRKKKNREQKEQEEALQFEIRQQKRKEKHKGH